ncbi:multicopper oxidase [Azoarcus sp. PA01]|nr:multicopper oxidase [Azoarcus sp. PA01]
MITRRLFLKATLWMGAVLLPWKWGSRHASAAPIPGGTLDPTTISKYRMQLLIPPAMPQTPPPTPTVDVDYYEIAVRQFEQQILPAGMPMTTVWSYGSVNHPDTFHYPAFTIEARYGAPVRVKWINGLVDEHGRYLQHLLPVDASLHWANPAGGPTGRDAHPVVDATPGPYTGPVPIVTHLHGGHTHDDSDGFTEAWYLPQARNIPGGFARVGSEYQRFRAEAQARMGQAWTPGSAVFEYENDQDAATLWYHDHTLGMTRLNVYAGPAGFYLIRGGGRDLPDGVLPGPAAGVGADPFGRHYEIPLAIQDRSFNADGSLFYPDSRTFFDGYEGPYFPHTEVAPIWNPEFFGNTIVVNGRTWPYLEVEPRRYRFRLLNGCNSRFLILEFDDPDLAFWQIGADGGFLPAATQLRRLLLAPAERADVIVDFTGRTVGEQIVLRNHGPDEPFGGGEPDEDFDAADPGTTGQVMQFRIVPLTAADPSTPAPELVLPALTPLGAATLTRKVALNEKTAGLPDFDGPVEAKLGIIDENGVNIPLDWQNAVTENPALGSIETWEIHNFTEDAHPIHIHEVQFEVVDRQPFDGAPYGPESGETGVKDTVIAYPGEITRVKALFDRPGLYVWHCHILEHEDNEMMRRYVIGPMTAADAGHR